MRLKLKRFNGATGIAVSLLVEHRKLRNVCVYDCRYGNEDARQEWLRIFQLLSRGVIT